MKKNSKILNWCGVIMLSACSIGLAQENGKANSNGPGSNSGLEETEHYFDLVFKGGSLVEFFSHVNEQVPHSVNVVLPPEGELITIQPMEIRNVSIEEVIKTLDVIGHQDWQLLKTGQNLWTFVGQVPKEKPSPREASMQAYPLGGYVGIYQPDDLITLFTKMWEYTDVEAPEAMTYHEETKMLLVKATPEQDVEISRLIDSVGQGLDFEEMVMTKIRRAEEVFQSKAKDLERETMALREAIAESEDKSERLREELVEAETRVKELTLELVKLKQSN